MPLNIKNNEDYLFNVMVFFNAEKSIYEDKTPYHYILRKIQLQLQKYLKIKFLIR